MYKKIQNKHKHTWFLTDMTRVKTSWCMKFIISMNVLWQTRHTSSMDGQPTNFDTGQIGFIKSMNWQKNVTEWKYQKIHISGFSSMNKRMNAKKTIFSSFCFSLTWISSFKVYVVWVSPVWHDNETKDI